MEGRERQRKKKRDVYMHIYVCTPMQTLLTHTRTRTQGRRRKGGSRMAKEGQGGPRERSESHTNQKACLPCLDAFQSTCCCSKDNRVTTPPHIPTPARAFPVACSDGVLCSLAFKHIGAPAPPGPPSPSGPPHCLSQRRGGGGEHALY